jgi:DNA polymerase-1
LLEAPTHQIDDHIRRLTTIMQHASELVLGDGRTCGVDVDVVHYPNRYSDERGEIMWGRVMKLLPEADDVLAV